MPENMLQTYEITHAKRPFFMQRSRHCAVEYTAIISTHPCVMSSTQTPFKNNERFKMTRATATMHAAQYNSKFGKVNKLSVNMAKAEQTIHKHNAVLEQIITLEGRHQLFRANADLIDSDTPFKAASLQSSCILYMGDNAGMMVSFA